MKSEHTIPANSLTVMLCGSIRGFALVILVLNRSYIPMRILELRTSSVELANIHLGYISLSSHVTY